MKNLKITTLLVPMLFCCAPVALTASASYAADSSFMGITIPRIGAEYNVDRTPFEQTLKSLAGERDVAQKPTGAEAEIWIWKGDAYRADRVKFTRSALESALEAAGYKVIEITPNDIRETNIFNYFDFNDSSLPFIPTHSAQFFRASSDAKGRAFVGAWLQSDDALTLSLLPVQFKATPKPKPLPTVASNVILVKNIDNTLSSLPKRPLPAFPALQRKPRMVRGWLKDTAGRPVVGAEVAVYSSVGGGFRTTHKGYSNAQGLYQVLLPTGIAEVAQVDTNLNYNGRKFTLQLDPVTGVKKQFNAQNGHVENYILRAEGKSGGTIRLTDSLDSGILEVTITPVGRQMDGSMGRTLVYRFDTGVYHSETYLNGMPLGRYKLTARLLEDGEALPVRVRRTFGDDQKLRSSVQVDFEPGYTFSQVNFDKSNHDVQFFEVAIEP